ncbi:MAG: hypothetical protein WBL65_10100 [Bryobacteraceae bacterium]
MRNASSHSVKRYAWFAVLLVFGIRPLPSATLQQLTMNDMIAQSAAIVRGTVVDSWAALTGSVIYTHYKIQVSESLKGPRQSSVEIVVAGGVVNNLSQSFSGSPTLNKGDQFVLFLWTSRAGLTQIMGLTQGLFAIAPGASTDPMATRAATRELMLDPKTAQPVKDAVLSMHLSDLRSLIANTLQASQGVSQ